MNPTTPDLVSDRPTSAPRTGGGMPPPVIAGVVIEALLSLNALLAGQILWAGVGVALCVGLHHRVVIAQRLVLLGALLGALLVGGLILATALSLMSLDDGPKLAILSLGLAPALLYIGARVAQIVALTRPDAKTFFGLDCPACGSHAFRAKSPIYSLVACRTCGHAWRPGPRAPGDPQPVA